MSQVEHFAERSFAIKGDAGFTAQRDQFTIMEDAYLVCDGKKLQGFIQRCQSNIVKLRFWMQREICDSRNKRHPRSRLTSTLPGYWAEY